MRQPKPVCVDFETFGIQSRPFYPPVPVGVSIMEWGKKPHYYAWGHREGNNCTYAQARDALAKAWKCSDGVLCHHAKFDYDVATTHMGMPELPAEQLHDTVFLLFLDSPHTKDLGLKPSADRLLGMPPDERDAVADWLVTVQPIPGIKIGRGKGAKHPAGAYIAYAPGDLVGAYANGDVIRTQKIFEKLWKSVCIDRKMHAAYQREQRLMPVLLASERGGVRVDLDRLRADVKMYGAWLVKIDEWIRAELGHPQYPDPRNGGAIGPLNIDASQRLADALIKAGKADPERMGITPGGGVATNKAAIEAGVTDKVMAAVLTYRAQLSTCYGTFLVPWLAVAERSGGLIYTHWNQTKGERGGARTGRLSSTPNFQNTPKEFAAIFVHEVEKALLAQPEYAYLIGRICPWPDLPPLPLCRGYIIAMCKDHVLIDRDYSQQEPRILGHFEDGALLEQYKENPWIDFHDNAKESLEKIMNKKYQRRPVKNINLGLIYGQGVGSLAIKNNSTVDETREIKDAILAMYPGLKEMYKDMRKFAKLNKPIVTWGGREYYCEEPIIVKGKLITFDYKMVNVLVQGSAADCTKEAMIRLWAAMVKARKHNSWFFMLQVHDSLVLSVPIEDAEEANEMMRAAMEGVEFNVPMLSEGSFSKENWNAMIDHDKKGKVVHGFR
jgi:DNA polymerase I-like protein with 3'-5' exonuclease and polymerase domains